VKYEQPYGIGDPNASYINGDPSIGRQGSIPPAAAFENPQREIVNLIGDAAQMPTDEDLHQTTRAVRDGKLQFCVDTGILNSLQIALKGPPILNYQAGLALRVLVAHSVTGPSTLTIGALNAVAIKRRDGSETGANDLLAGQIATLVHDGTFFQLVNMGVSTGGGGTINNYFTDIPYVRDTGTANHLIGAYSPALPDLREGRTVEIRVLHNTTGPVDFTPNSFPTKPVVHPDGTPLNPGDGVVNQIWLLCYDGADWQLLSACCGAQPATAPVPQAGPGRSLQFRMYIGSTPNVVTAIGASGTCSYLMRRPSINSNRQIWTYSVFMKNPDTVTTVDNNPEHYATGNPTYAGVQMWVAAEAAMQLSGLNWAKIYGKMSFGVLWNSVYYGIVQTTAPWVTGSGLPSPPAGTIVGYFQAGSFTDQNWHHLCWKNDGATSIVTIDGVVWAQGSTSGQPSTWNSTVPHMIGARPMEGGDGTPPYEGCAFRMAEIMHVDGQCLDWSVFCKIDNGVVIPILPTDPASTFNKNYGPNGFYLNFQDSSMLTANTLGKDVSGQGNNFTPVNFQPTDVLTDYPGK